MASGFLTSRACRIAVAVCWVCLGIVTLATVHAAAHRFVHSAVGVCYVTLGVVWGISTLPRRKLRQ
jgi:hypothetical protein